MTSSIPYIAIGVVVLTIGPINAVQASGPYDGTWSSSKPTSGRARCRMGKTTLTILDNSVKGEVENLFIDVRDDNEKERVVMALQHAAVDRITAPSRGGGIVDAIGSITITGTVSPDGMFSGLVAGQQFTGKFTASKFSGAVSSQICETKVTLKRKQ